MNNPQRKVVAVGAGSGTGAATAAHLHERGHFVLAVDGAFITSITAGAPVTV